MSRQGKHRTGPFAGASFHVWALHVSLFLDPRYCSMGHSHDGFMFKHIFDIGPIRILWEHDPDENSYDAVWERDPDDNSYDAVSKRYEMNPVTPASKPTNLKAEFLMPRPKDTQVCPECKGSRKVVTKGFHCICPKCNGKGWDPYNWKAASRPGANPVRS
jgi:hypothetical protein